MSVSPSAVFGRFRRSMMRDQHMPGSEERLPVDRDAVTPNTAEQGRQEPRGEPPIPEASPTRGAAREAPPEPLQSHSEAGTGEEAPSASPPDTGTAALEPRQATPGVPAKSEASPAPARQSRRHDWPAIRVQYVEGVVRNQQRVLPTFEELAKAHGVNAASLRRLAAKERWSEARTFFAARVQQTKQQTQQEHSDALGVTCAFFDAQCAEMASSMVRLVNAELARIAPKDGALFDRRAAMELMAIGKAAQAIGRLAVGDPMEITEARHREAGLVSPNYEDLTTEELCLLHALLERACGKPIEVANPWEGEAMVTITKMLVESRNSAELLKE